MPMIYALTIDTDTVLTVIKNGGSVLAICVLGYIVRLFVTGELYSKKSMERETARGDRLELLVIRMAELGERAAAVGKTIVEKLPPPPMQ